MIMKRILNTGCKLNGILWVDEGHHEAVTNGLDFVAVVFEDKFADLLVVDVHRLGHLVRNTGPQRGAGLNVSENNGEGFVSVFRGRRVVPGRSIQKEDEGRNDASDHDQSDDNSNRNADGGTGRCGQGNVVDATCRHLVRCGSGSGIDRTLNPVQYRVNVEAPRTFSTLALPSSIECFGW